MKKVLLHTCCAPCTTQVHVALVCGGFKVSGFFYNPNIYPKKEHQKRKDSMERYSSIMDLPMLYVENDLDHEPGVCLSCYKMRLLHTAQYAGNAGFDAFTTTLLISPYQKHDLIKMAGEEVENMTGVEFLYKDFRPDYRKSRALAKMYNLYMQKYCGCSFSLEEREVANEQTP